MRFAQAPFREFCGEILTKLKAGSCYTIVQQEPDTVTP